MAHNDSKSLVAEEFIRALKGKMYKNMTANYSKLVNLALVI